MNRALRLFVALVIAAPAFGLISANAAAPESWKWEWPKTDFDKALIDLNEIMSGGVAKDQIPSIDRPRFIALSENKTVQPTEPVVGLTVNGVSKAYPLQVLTWHEIVNDEIGGVPVAVTYCPLCNAAIVFERKAGERMLTFGTTGKLRNSDLVMYDRQTQSWWQQFEGRAIVGELAGSELRVLPARLESLEKFAARKPDGRLLVPNDSGMRFYGRNPYGGYDSASRPFLYRGSYPEGIAPMARVVAVGDTAWSLDLLREQTPIQSGDLVLTWEPGQNSALDTSQISEGRDVGNVVVQRRAGSGLEDVAYDVTFAFVFHSFRPEGTIHK